LVGADVYYIRDCIPGEQESMLHELDGIYRIILLSCLKKNEWKFPRMELCQIT